MGKVDATKDELRRMYWDERMSSVEIAEQFDVYHSTIINQLDKHGIERRSSQDASKEAVRVEYANHRLHNGRYPVWEDRWGGGTKVKVHQLLAISEGADPSVVFDDSTAVHHKNGVPWDNRPENLEVLSHADHTQIHSIGEDNRNAKLTVEDVKEIKRLLMKGDLSQREIADRFDTTQTNISCINTGESWESVEI